MHVYSYDIVLYWHVSVIGFHFNFDVPCAATNPQDLCYVLATIHDRQHHAYIQAFGTIA